MLELFQVAHFFNVSPIEVHNWPPAWYAYAVSYIAWYIKNLPKKGKGGKNKKEPQPEKRRLDVLEEREGRVRNGGRGTGIEASTLP